MTKKVIFFICLFLSLNVSYSKNVHNILIVDSQTGEPYETVRESLVNELAKLGYQEGNNLNISYYSLGNSQGKAISIWKRIEKDKKHDVIFVNGTMATIAFKDFVWGQEQHRVVFASVTDPVGIGVIDNFSSPPKSNFTGISYPVKVIDRLRFIKQMLPNAKKIGFIYAEMPQSISYKGWINEALKLDEFKDLKFYFKGVPFVEGEKGSDRMTMLSKQLVHELNDEVDVFLSPNDQLGVRHTFVKMMSRNAKKPLIGLGEKDVMEKWGATMSIFPDSKASGKKLAHIIKKLIEGGKIKDFIPSQPEAGIAFDLSKIKRFDIKIPPQLLKRAGKNIVPK